MPAWPQSVPLAAQNSSTRFFTVRAFAVPTGVVLRHHVSLLRATTCRPAAVIFTIGIMAV